MISTIPVPSHFSALADLPRLMAPARKEEPVATRRPVSPSDMMNAWSMAASSRTASFAKSSRLDEHCPPEVYLG